MTENEDRDRIQKFLSKHNEFYLVDATAKKIGPFSSGQIRSFGASDYESFVQIIADSGDVLEIEKVSSAALSAGKNKPKLEQGQNYFARLVNLAPAAIVVGGVRLMSRNNGGLTKTEIILLTGSLLAAFYLIKYLLKQADRR